MLIIRGPLCLSCGGSNVIERREWGPVMWSTDGVTEGWKRRTVCLDCEKDTKQMIERFVEDAVKQSHNKENNNG